MQPRVFLALLIFTLGCDRTAQEPVVVPVSSYQAPSSSADASTVIEQLKEVHVEAYHQYLRDAYFLLTPKLKGQPWADVQDLMKRHGFAAFEAWENGDAIHSYHLLKKDCAIFPNEEQTLDLCLLLSANNLDRGRFPVRPGQLYNAHLALTAAFELPYPDVVKRGFPKDSVLDVVLRSETVKEAGELWPVLKRIYVYYGYLFNRWAEHSPSGFSVVVEFAASAKEKIGGKRMYLYVPSGLDPLMSMDGTSKLLDGFESRDTLGGVSGGGSNEWWQGTPDVVQANKQKYLKKK